MFGSSKKLGQTEFIFHVDRKIPCLTWNSFSGFILPSNDFHPRKIEERERARETTRRSHQKRVLSHLALAPTPDLTIREREADHLNLISTTPPSGSCLLHHRLPTIINPPLPHHQSTNTQDPPLWSWMWHFACLGLLPWVMAFAR